MNNKQTYRYPGAQPFSTAQQDLFFGREDDIAALSRMIRLEALVVLYSKSGLGKSSLLSAGIVPEMEREGKYQAVQVRFNAYSESLDENRSPVQTALAAVQQQLGEEHTFVEDFLPQEESLWYSFKRFQAQQPERELLLLFDQFEELFTYPEAAILDFKQQLAEVLNTQIPQRFRALVEQEVNQRTGILEDTRHLSSEQLQLLHTSYQARVLFAIRSDRMSLLDRISDYLPIVKRAWYELDALTELQAEEAIYNPAYKEGNFRTPIFDYSDDTVDAILNYLTKDHQQKIESFQLQILCQAIERKVEQQGLTIVQRSDIGNIQTVYENYYDDQIQQLASPEDQLAARRFIEEGLVFEEEERRLSLYEGQIHRQYGISNELLAQLTDTHLIRREPSMRGGYTYELSHDTLVPAILKAKQERVALEEEDRQAKALREERKKRRRANLIAAVGVALAVISLVAGTFAIWSAQEANKSKQQALKNLDLANIERERADSTATRLERVSKKELEAKLSAELAKDVLQSERDKTKFLLRQTQRTLNELEQKNSAVVQLILENAELDILNLRYDAALEKIQSAASIGASKETIATALLEIAFYQNEIGNSQRALGLLDSTATLLQQPISLELKSDTVQARQQLRNAMQQLLPDYFDYLLGEKYYPKMVEVKGGTFWMGCDTTLNQSCGEDETWHQQTVSDFKMAKYETTVWQFALYCAATPDKDIKDHLVATWRDMGDNPVVKVSWFDAILYSNWVNQQLGLEEVYVLSNKRNGTYRDYYDVEWKPNAKGFQLPTEARWEYAAKGGAARSPFVYSGDSLIAKVAWYGVNSGSRTQKVGSKNPNVLGLHDLSGNVWEWCWDWYASYPESNSANYRGPVEEGKYRILRGGSWLYNYNDCRVSYRYYNNPDFRIINIGFRLLR
ncbi:MAG: SUMF1/EgtB/PvdO family nonheme iron enzyme [Bacteroidota bacterium]